jgi:hypothetical protein
MRLKKMPSGGSPLVASDPFLGSVLSTWTASQAKSPFKASAGLRQHCLRQMSHIESVSSCWTEYLGPSCHVSLLH